MKIGCPILLIKKIREKDFHGKICEEAKSVKIKALRRIRADVLKSICGD